MNSEKEPAMQNESTTLASPHSGGRFAQFTRAAVLVVIGLAITFTATLHEQFSFDHLILIIGLTLIGAATIVEYLALRGTAESWWIAARATVAIAAAGSLLVVQDGITLALVISIWALLTAVITLMRLVRRSQPTRVSLPSLLLSVCLAIAVFIFRDDLVAVTGFFGAYALIRGVFLGIAAFDPRPTADAVSEVADQNPGTHTTSGAADD